MAKKQTKKKPYWEMTLDELRAATREFDADMPPVKGRPLSKEARARFEKAMSRPAKSIFVSRKKKTVKLEIDPMLLEQLDELARQKQITRSQLIERGFRSMLAFVA